MMRGYQENYQRASAATKVLNDTAVEGTLLTVAPSTCELDA